METTTALLIAIPVLVLLAAFYGIITLRFYIFYMLVAAIGAALLKFGQTGLKLFAGEATGSFTVGRSIFGVGTNLSVALIAVAVGLAGALFSLTNYVGFGDWEFVGINNYRVMFTGPTGTNAVEAAQEPEVIDTVRSILADCYFLFGLVLGFTLTKLL